QVDLDEVIEVAKTEPFPQTRLVVGRQRDPPPPRQFEQGPRRHCALEVDVQLHLGQRAQERLETHSPCPPAAVSRAPIAAITAGGTRPSTLPPSRKTSLTSRLDR